MSRSFVARGNPWSATAKPPTTTNSTPCSTSTRRLVSASSCCGGTFAVSSQLPRTLPVTERGDPCSEPTQLDGLGDPLGRSRPGELGSALGGVVWKPIAIAHSRRPRAPAHTSTVSNLTDNAVVRSDAERLLFSPSDLSGFLACPHLTTLELLVARGERSKPHRHDPH